MGKKIPFYFCSRWRTTLLCLWCFEGIVGHDESIDVDVDIEIVIFYSLLDSMVLVNGGSRSREI